MNKYMNLALGLLMAGIGTLGAFLPVLPSTVFFICAMYFFGKSSPRLEQWLLNHPRFGYSLRIWKDHKAITPSGKKWALSGMTLGLILLLISQAPVFVKAGGIIFILGSAIYVRRLSLANSRP